MVFRLHKVREGGSGKGIIRSKSGVSTISTEEVTVFRLLGCEKTLGREGVSTEGFVEMMVFRLRC